jgi:hypothetical protein
MKKITFTLISLVLCFILVGCNHESKSAISKYSGDGKIKHLDSPGILGIDGIEIKFKKFDLSKNFNAKYSLQGLPVGKPYMIYLVVPDPVPLNEFKSNSFQLRVLNNGRVALDLRRPIGKMINNQQQRLNRFYCLKGYQDMQESSQVDAKTEGNYSIELNYENTKLNERVFGYLLLERGGFK